MSRTSSQEVLRRRTADRAYYAWLNGATGDAEYHWLVAERVEQAFQAIRRRAAFTREYNKGN